MRLFRELEACAAEYIAFNGRSTRSCVRAECVPDDRVYWANPHQSAPILAGSNEFIINERNFNSNDNDLLARRRRNCYLEQRCVIKKRCDVIWFRSRFIIPHTQSSHTTAGVKEHCVDINLALYVRDCDRLWYGPSGFFGLPICVHPEQFFCSIKIYDVY